MLIYPENGYEVEIVDNALTSTFSVWFQSKPEDLVFHLLRAVGFRDRSFGREFYHTHHHKIRSFADELQRTLSHNCFPVEIPYQSRYEHSVESITKFKFSIATITYLNHQKKSHNREFVIFETNRPKRKSFAWLMGYLEHGEALSKVETTEKIKRKEASQLFNEGLYKIKIPTPFGSGYLAKKREPPNGEIVPNFNENNRLKNGIYQQAFNGTNNEINLSAKVGVEVSSVDVENLEQISLSELFRHYANNELKDGLNNVIEDKMREIVNPPENTFEYLKVFLPIDRINKENNRPKQIAPLSEPYTEIFMHLYEVIPNMIQEINRDNDVAQLMFNRDRVLDEYCIFFFEIEKDGRYNISFRKTREKKDWHGNLPEERDEELFYAFRFLIDPYKQTAEAVCLEEKQGKYEVYHRNGEQTFVDLKQKQRINLFALKELAVLKKEKELIDLSGSGHVTVDA